MFNGYLSALHKTSSSGDATESSYYSALKGLIEEYALSKGIRGIQAITIPKKTEGGNPDFKVCDNKHRLSGYIEAKDPKVADLNAIEDTPQLKRYLSTFDNLILTNFLEFRLYRSGKIINKVILASPLLFNKARIAPPAEKSDAMLGLLEKFFSFSLPNISSAQQLAHELAKRTKFLRDEVIKNELGDKGNEYIHGFFEAFRKYLIYDLKSEDFADLYSQTVTYGLFAARTRSGTEFNRKLAYDYIPKSIGILRDVFKFISLEDIPKPMEWIVDDISETLANTDVKKILHEYYREHKGEDPIVHFYETFLAEYDPATRERRGVYYTPEPVVFYIVHSLNNILKEHFGKPEGFASKGVTVLDPAGGTLTFMSEAVKLAVKEYTESYGEGAKERFIRDNILNNFYAFELMMAPYAIGHMKMAFTLEELGCALSEDEKFKLYLTNTLEFKELEEIRIPGLSALSDESHKAGEIKRNKPILVIMGNPPYSGHSANKDEWILKEIKSYFQVDGHPLGEKNPKWLQDDYVKFIRFSQWKIEQAGEGVLGFITNHSYLDNPTFRGMRQSLMKTFNEICILDLHGNSLKKEVCPDGSKDENVFDIQQGVAIALFIKKKGMSGCKVRHADLYGRRDVKYKWLDSHDRDKTKWAVLAPKSEFYLFVPRDERLGKKYERFVKVTDIFPVNSVGVVTSRDEFVIDANKQSLKKRILELKNESQPDEIIKQTYGLRDKASWKLKTTREEIRHADINEHIIPILYRPFDTQYIFYHDALIERLRKEVMRHMMRENYSLCVGRAGQVVGTEKPWNIVFCSKYIEDFNLFYRGGNVNFPLYLYKSSEQPKRRSFTTAMLLFEPQAEYVVKVPNINPDVFNALKSAYGRTPSPEAIFHYVYAVLYSNTYRNKYPGFLRIDFPRVPFTSNKELFKKLGELGKELVSLHLMEHSAIGRSIAKFEGKGENNVDKLIYDESNSRLYVNKSQYFEGIKDDVYEYQIGGYQVAMKWLKDRKGRKLSSDDITHYCHIVTALSKTIKIQTEIDTLYPDAEKEVVKI